MIEAMLRFCWVFSWIALSSIVLYPVAQIAALLPWSRKKVPHLIARFWAKSIVKVSGVKVKMIGLENLDLNRPYIFAANHQSQYDIFTLMGFLPFQFKWMAKQSLFYIPFVGWGIKACGHIPVKRESPKEAYKALLKAIKKVKEGYSIVIFPEGTRSPDGRIGPFKGGAMLLALRTNTPIVPVTIIGTKDILPKGGKRLKKGKVLIVIDKPIDVSSFSERDKQTLANMVRDIIVKNYKTYGDYPNDACSQ